MSQKALNSNQKLQTIWSWISDRLSRKDETTPKGDRCTICATFSIKEAVFFAEPYGRLYLHIEVGLMSEVKVRVQVNECPLCQVVLHVVS
jgi:hypothetical protein